MFNFKHNYFTQIMKKFLVAVVGCIAATLVACTDKNAFSVTMTVPAETVGQEFKLMNDTVTLASTVAEDTVITFKGTIDTPALVYATSENRPVAFFVVEPGKIVIDKDRNATGTPTNDAFTAFITANEEADNYPELAMDFITKNPENLYAPFLFNQCSYKATVEQLDACKNYSWAADIDPERFDKMRKAAEARENTGVGTTYVDVVCEQPDSTTLSLSGLMEGKKYTIVDFWASWCPPCRAEIPGLIKLYNEYSNQGLQVVGVDVWDTAEACQTAVEQLGINYPIIIGGGRENSPSELYGIMAIPEIMVIDADGTIISRGVMGEKLAEFIAEKMN